MKNLRLRKILRWIAVIIWMGVIFYLSHQPGTESSNLSSGITDFVIQTIDTLLPFISVDEALFHHLIRKSAHFTAYFLLGLLVNHAIRLPYGKRLVTALVICILFATSDEVHQLFIVGRSGEVRDVLIDSTGAATGIGVYMLGEMVFHRFRKKDARECR